MKSSPNAAILKVSVLLQPERRQLNCAAPCAPCTAQLFASLGLQIDASSCYEVQRAMAAGIAAEKARGAQCGHLLTTP